jgi:hypothetical protein
MLGISNEYNGPGSSGVLEPEAQEPLGTGGVRDPEKWLEKSVIAPISFSQITVGHSTLL